ncbi:elongin-C-like isoform X4 [Chenopodium quinoa]|uniref:elongin-C-like isoform X4 n=1 Tax=Chenopodium quinoa TaxID=63459 RepID=UPI000B78A57D|nr:elongin-C-like isoform X4 [Chenopodium quinoa]
MEKEETVKLISSEGFEFVIDRKAAMVSQFLRNLLTSPGNFAETENGIVRFPDISTTILEKICQYFYWSRQYARTVSGKFWTCNQRLLEEVGSCCFGLMFG